jgi:hypothetical protein
MRLTKANVAKLSLPEGKNELLVFDEALAGFGTSPIWRQADLHRPIHRIGSKQRRLSLGSSETLDAEEARKRAKMALSKVSLGTDPQIEKTNGRLKASVTIGATVESYLARRESHLKPNSLADVRRYLRATGLHSTKSPSILSRGPWFAAANGLYASNRARAALSTFYSWAIGEGLANENPVVGTNKAIVEETRDRILTPAELRLAWQLAGPGDFGAIVRLLIFDGPAPRGSRRDALVGTRPRRRALDLERTAQGTVWRMRSRFRSPLRRSCAQSHVATIGTTFSAPPTVPFRVGRMPRRRSTNG